MKKISFLLVFAILFSCKKDSKSEVKQDSNIEETTPKMKVVENFTLTLKGIVEKDDKFQMFYFETDKDPVSEKKSVWAKVTPSKEEQEIKFVLPKDVYPMNVRIDLGVNNKQENITINECVLQYKKYDYKINGKELVKYFTLNQCVKMVSDSINYNLMPMKVGEVKKYDPYIVGNKLFENILIEEL